MYYFGLVLHSSNADKVHLWRSAIREFLAFSLIFFVVAAREGFFVSKTSDLQIFVERLGVLVPVPDRLAFRMNDLGFFAIICKTISDGFLEYLELSRGQQVNWSWGDLAWTSNTPFYFSLEYGRSYSSGRKSRA